MFRISRCLLTQLVNGFPKQRNIQVCVNIVDLVRGMTDQLSADFLRHIGVGQFRVVGVTQAVEGPPCQRSLFAFDLLQGFDFDLHRVNPGLPYELLELRGQSIAAAGFLFG